MEDFFLVFLLLLTFIAEVILTIHALITKRFRRGAKLVGFTAWLGSFLALSSCFNDPVSVLLVPIILGMSMYLCFLGYTKSMLVMEKSRLSYKLDKKGYSFVIIIALGSLVIMLAATYPIIKLIPDYTPRIIGLAGMLAALIGSQARKKYGIPINNQEGDPQLNLLML